MSSPITSTTPLELIFIPKGRTVVKFQNGYQGEALFSQDYRHLQEAMALVGIPIPSNERKDYPTLSKDRIAIHLKEVGFGKAFYEIYFKTMDPSKFEWRVI